MGCIQSKPSKRQGLFHQQEEIISRQGNQEEIVRQGNNNKDDSEKVCGPANPTPAQPPSRHSPPASRPPRSNSPKPPLEGLGGLQEAWASPKHWDEFVLWLKSQSEGDDPDGVPKLLSRYATWLELYARLDAEERAGAGRERLAALTIGLMEHEEGFLDRYRCLSCWDGGMRAAALDRDEAGQVGVAVFLPLYPRVVSWLQEKLGSYQNVVLSKKASR